MTSWIDFEMAEPEFAARARTLISATTNCVLATIRADGSPRASGIDPFFFDDVLMLGSMPNSRKAADLHRDPRLALHGIPWESRKVKEGTEDPGKGDVKITGRGISIDDPTEVQRIFAAYWASLGIDTPPSDGEGELFIVDLDSVVLIGVEDDQLVIDRWSATEGRDTIRRT